MKIYHAFGVITPRSIAFLTELLSNLNRGWWLTVAADGLWAPPGETTQSTAGSTGHTVHALFRRITNRKTLLGNRQLPTVSIELDRSPVSNAIKRRLSFWWRSHRCDSNIEDELRSNRRGLPV